MTQVVTIPKQNKSITFTNEQMDLIRKVICKDATETDLQFFFHQAQQYGLDPLSRQVYLWKDKSGKPVIHTGIDGLRLIADRTKQYIGSSSPLFHGAIADGNLRVKITVQKIIGERVGEFSAVAFYSEYAGRSAIWQSKPHIMLAKCAEALALRKAFPADLSGIYTKEELDQSMEEPKWQNAKPQPKQLKPKSVKKPSASPAPNEEKYPPLTDTPEVAQYGTPNVSRETSGGVEPASEFQITFGKFKGKFLRDVPLNELVSYASWLKRQDKTSENGLKTIEAIDLYALAKASLGGEEPQKESASEGMDDIPF